jgi:hypothetical protein
MNEPKDKTGNSDSSNCSSSVRRILGLFVVERKHCDAMASHYANVDKNNEKWHFWYGRKQVCDEVIAAMRAELEPPPKKDEPHPYDSHSPRQY